MQESLLKGRPVYSITLTTTSKILVNAPGRFIGMDNWTAKDELPHCVDGDGIMSCTFGEYLTVHMVAQRD